MKTSKSPTDLNLIFLLVTISALSACHSYKAVEPKSGKEVVVEKFEYSAIDYKVQDEKYIQFYKGIKIVEGFYRKDKKSGVWQFFNYAGKLSFARGFDNDLKDGKWTYFYNHGKLASEIFFNQGAIDSVTGFHENGVLAYEMKIENDSGGMARLFQLKTKELMGYIDFTMTTDCLSTILQFNPSTNPPIKCCPESV